MTTISATKLIGKWARRATDDEIIVRLAQLFDWRFAEKDNAKWWGFSEQIDVILEEAWRRKGITETLKGWRP
jgi:hypothetical protein